MIRRRCQIAAKIEEVEGTAITLAAADVISNTYEAKYDPDIKYFKRNPSRASLSQAGGRTGQKSSKISFKVDLHGSGSKGVAPSYGKLLKACGFGEAIGEGATVTYTPASDAIPCLTMAMYIDGVIKRIKGARGTVRFVHKVGEPVMMEFEFTGVLDFMATGAMLTAVSYATTVPPAFLNATLLLDSYAAIVSGLTIDIANEIALRDSANGADGYISAVITGRDPKGSIDPETCLTATYDLLTKLKADTLMMFTETLGTVDGNKFIITAPKVQYTGMKDAERSGIDVTALDLAFCMSSGDDEISIQQL